MRNGRTAIHPGVALSGHYHERRGPTDEETALRFPIPSGSESAILFLSTHLTAIDDFDYTR